jgi:hypothetical protein
VPSSCLAAQSVFSFRVLGIVDQQTALIRERGLRLLKGHTMLLPVGFVLPFISIESKLGHAYIVPTLYVCATPVDGSAMDESWPGALRW